MRRNLEVPGAPRGEGGGASHKGITGSEGGRGGVMRDGGVKGGNVKARGVRGGGVRGWVVRGGGVRGGGVRQGWGCQWWGCQGVREGEQDDFDPNFCPKLDNTPMSTNYN